MSRLNVSISAWKVCTCLEAHAFGSFSRVGEVLFVGKGVAAGCGVAALISPGWLVAKGVEAGCGFDVVFSLYWLVALLGRYGLAYSAIGSGFGVARLIFVA